MLRPACPHQLVSSPVVAAPDDIIRTAVFQFLAERTNGGQDAISWSALTKECVVAGETVVLIGASGIWKPRQLELPISIATAPPKSGRPAPYQDGIDADGLLMYKYRGTDPMHRDNVGMRQAMEQRKGLVYLHGVSRGWYLATWPAFIIEDNPDKLSVKVSLMDPGQFRPDLAPAAIEVAEQRYYSRLTRQRLHQADFRHRVLAAYREQCGFCHLRHTELLDAAHIRPDSHGGSPATSNGMALCKIHHAAFDHHIVGVRPDHVLEIRQNVLDEVDGPMLRFGLQALNGQKLIVPRKAADKPDPQAIEERYEAFLAR
jgi:putative restriction endonuclease